MDKCDGSYLYDIVARPRPRTVSVGDAASMYGDIVEVKYFENGSATFVFLSFSIVVHEYLF